MSNFSLRYFTGDRSKPRSLHRESSIEFHAENYRDAREYAMDEIERIHDHTYVVRAQLKNVHHKRWETLVDVDCPLRR